MDLQTDTDFTAANVIVDRVDGDEVWFRPDLRDTEGPWFYWCFGLRGAAGRRVRFHIGADNALTAAGAAVSYDQGWTWQWLAREDHHDDHAFSLTVPPDTDEVRLSLAMPYTAEQWYAFADGHRDHPRFAAGVLCQSPSGRDVPQAVVGPRDAEADYRIVVTARHHCCEMMASYTLEGLLEAALADDDLGRWFAKHVQVLAIPFVDFDGVEAGDQGKNRRPRDHNRDYSDPSIYPETAAIRCLLPQWAGRRLRVALDLHCPWVRGPSNEVIYLVGSRDPQQWRQQCRFGDLLESSRQGPLPYRAEDNLPFGQQWNVEANDTQGCSCSRWMTQLPGVQLATTIEIPYALAHDQPVDQSSARLLGHDLAGALKQYLTTADDEALPA